MGISAYNARSMPFVGKGSQGDSEEMGPTPQKKDDTRVLARIQVERCTVELVEDDAGSCFLRRSSADGQEISRSAALHSDPAALADARELFPEHVPFGALPVDAD
jgi:hypothetical protein